MNVHPRHGPARFPEDDEALDLHRLIYDAADPAAVRRIERLLMERHGLTRPPLVCDDRPRGWLGWLRWLGTSTLGGQLPPRWRPRVRPCAR